MRVLRCFCDGGCESAGVFMSGGGVGVLGIGDFYCWVEGKFMLFDDIGEFLLSVAVVRVIDGYVDDILFGVVVVID